MGFSTLMGLAMTTFRLDDMRQHSDLLRLPGGKSVTVRFVEPAGLRCIAVLFPGAQHALALQSLPGRSQRTASTALDQFIHVGENDRFSVIVTVTAGDRDRHYSSAKRATRSMPETASFEFGLSIDDSWQGQGIGSALLANLQCRAAAFGAAHLFGDTLRSNGTDDRARPQGRFFFHSLIPTTGSWCDLKSTSQFDAAGNPLRQLAACGASIRAPRAFWHLRLLFPGEHCFALVDKCLHRLAVIRGQCGADQAFGFMVTARWRNRTEALRQDCPSCSGARWSALRPSILPLQKLPPAVWHQAPRG